MAIAVAATSSGQTSTVTYPSGLAVGDVLVLHCAEKATASGLGAGPGFIDGTYATFTSLYTQNIGSNVTDLGSLLLYRVIDGTEGTGGTLNDYFGSSKTWAWECFRLTGVDTSSPINIQSALSNTANASIFNFPSVTTTKDNAFVMRFGATLTPTSALDTATVSSVSPIKTSRSTTVAGAGAWGAALATAGAAGTAASSTVASANSRMHQFTVAFTALLAKGRNQSEIIG